jgi:hypothetical protein
VGILPAQNQQARCLFHNTSSLLWGGHLARPKSTGKIPVPQYIKFIVGWDLARPKSTGKMPVPQYIKFIVGWDLARLKSTGKMPVPQ